MCVLVATKGEPDRSLPVFMAEAEWCGHDSRGNPTLRQGLDGTETLLDDLPLIAERFKDWQAGTETSGHLGFELPQQNIIGTVLVPRYYNPDVIAEISGLGSEYNFVTLGDLLRDGVVEAKTGVEVGKMAYGTGNIPFVRTSDLSNWEVKADPKQAVSQDIYKDHQSGADVQAGDILFVKDGTYLVGTSAVVTEWDLPMLYQSHIYRIRVKQPDVVSPWLLFALLNAPVVRRQVKAKQFTQDIIDTIGKRIMEVALPFPRSRKEARRIASECKRIIEARGRLRHEVSSLVHTIGAT